MTICAEKFNVIWLFKKLWLNLVVLKLSGIDFFLYYLKAAVFHKKYLT